MTMLSSNTKWAYGLMAAGMTGLVVLFAVILMFGWRLTFPPSLSAIAFSTIAGTGIAFYFSRQVANTTPHEMDKDDEAS